MKLEEVRRIVGADVVACADMLDREVEVGAAADLMSDVLANVKPRSLLVSGLNKVQVIYVADLAEVGGILFVRGKFVDDDIIELAEEKKMPVLSTKMRMYEACGRLFSAGLHPPSKE